jgi:hypothetical protein
MWSSRWNENWQGKPKYSGKTCPSATLSTTNPKWPDPGSNPCRCGGKAATNRLSYGTALYDKLSFTSIQNNGKIIALCSLGLCFYFRREDKGFWNNWYKEFPKLCPRFISYEYNFCFLLSLLNFATFLGNALPILIFWFCPALFVTRHRQMLRSLCHYF